jgi:hypothetical protein
MNVYGRFFALAAFAALAVNAAPVGAQSVSQSDSTPSPAVAATTTSQPESNLETRGPRLVNARVAVHTESAPIGAPPVIQNRSSNRNAVALMAVGGAALVVGAVIGDDAGTLVMLGGAVVGLYGLYLFLT